MSEELKKKLQECQKKNKEYLDGWQRARADFINYKKDEMERIESLVKYANLETIMKILPILDNFEKAEQELSGDQKKDSIVLGFLQIKAQFQDFLKNQGVQEMEAVGERFDPNFHEATEQVESKDQESDIIIEEVQKGYLINGQLLRPAKVKVVK